MWGIVPAAGMGSRIQPLAFSKELLPVGSFVNGSGERPRAVSEYLIERMVKGGVDKICFVISPGKSDIMDYFGGNILSATVFYAIQPKPAGLCDAIFRAVALIPSDEDVCIGLPDTIWFPETALVNLPPASLSLLLFPVEHPERFDAVVTDECGEVVEVQVKNPQASTNWIWGALRMPGSILKELYELWIERQDEYLGTLLNAYLARGGRAYAFKTGEAYVDVGTLNGYREALRLLDGHHDARVSRT
ncbi:MAG: nucleotidyltransferase family protein [Acidobacteriaceae bacterium]|nr:nucleotidyltransferase family protein [Acidobacteriaceae bacterium]MBV9302608.1 nucleotidyltransferase family protein [Acidobacteriaceae bacterium]MBV9763862.1 nucleotidyltransferase family protein [Acidobacteriaceae bacterium]